MHGINDTVVEWRESVLQRLAGPPLMKNVGSMDPTHYVRRFLTPLLSVPLSTSGMEHLDSQGTLTLWFHNPEDKDKAGGKVYGVSNCHVLRNNPDVDYEHNAETPADFVRVCGVRRFQRGIDEIMSTINDHGLQASKITRDIDGLEDGTDLDEEDMLEIAQNRSSLIDEYDAVRKLEALHEEIITIWSRIQLHRDIGYIQHAGAIKVDVEGGTRFTSDWGAFVVSEAKVKDNFKGNVVDLGASSSLLFV
jgi:hypothetical protein